MTRAAVVLGASGSLGSHLRAAAALRFDAMFAFDVTASHDERIKACDLADETQVGDVVGALPIEAHRHWALVVASGVYDGGASPDLRWPAISRSLSVNLLGVTQFICAFATRLVQFERTGRIVVVTSAAARVGSSDIGYGVSKSGLEGLVRSGSKIFARRGVTFIGVAPGLFASNMSRDQSEERQLAAVGATQLGRATTISEVSDVTLFALADAPDAMTGTFISPNGGQV